MKSDINIADILKNKPQGTKLYTDVFGELTVVNICPINKIGITLAGIKGKELWFYNDGRYSIHGEPILFPSNMMRDWSKFAWQKGDVLVNEYNAHVIFEKFEDNTYTTFIGRHYFDSDNSRYSYISRLYSLSTNQFHIEEGDAIQIYISNIEKEIGGKLKPFDKVLVRNGERQAWQISLFGYKTCLDYYCCNGSSWSLCIPYKGNEHLVGTTNNP